MASEAVDPAFAETRQAHTLATGYVQAQGVMVQDLDPATGVSWDGTAMWGACEPTLILHEYGHWLVCPPERRARVDFGLGPGPETGDKDRAAADACASFMTAQHEECLASLMGIALEARLGMNAMVALVGQNWLEAPHSTATAAHFRKHAHAIKAHLDRLPIQDYAV